MFSWSYSIEFFCWNISNFSNQPKTFTVVKFSILFACFRCVSAVSVKWMNKKNCFAPWYRHEFKYERLFCHILFLVPHHFVRYSSSDLQRHDETIHPCIMLIINGTTRIVCGKCSELCEVDCMKHLRFLDFSSPRGKVFDDFRRRRRHHHVKTYYFRMNNHRQRGSFSFAMRFINKKSTGKARVDRKLIRVSHILGW
jgi:hypothetical protein